MSYRHISRVLPVRTRYQNVLFIYSAIAVTQYFGGNLPDIFNIFSAPKLHRPCRDCIILFTDGIANLGETDPKRLIGKYRKTQKKMNRISCIPVSALTIGGYRPELLIEVKSVKNNSVVMRDRSSQLRPGQTL